MRRTFAALTFATLAATGCVENDQSLFISRIIEPTLDGECGIDPGSLLVTSRGILDVGVAALAGSQFGGYFVHPVITSGIAETGRQSDFIQVTGLDVTLDIPMKTAVNPLDLRPELVKTGAVTGAEAKALTNYFVPAAGGLLAPAAGNNIAFEADVIKYWLIREWSKLIPNDPTGLPVTIFVKLAPKGIRAGDTLKGAAIAFPIDVCHGCLATIAMSCNNVDPAIVKEGGCHPQQDTPVTCCQDPSAGMLCGANVPLPTM